MTLQNIIPVLCVCLVHCLGASIYEIASMREVYQYLPYDRSCILVCDIDNTLLEPSTWYGSEQWITYHLACKQAAGYSIQEALAHILPEYIRFQQEEMIPQLIEHEAIILLAYACNHNIPVYAVTSRDSKLISATHAQLTTLGITFTHTDGDIFDTGARYPACVSDGVVFTGSYDKGSALFQFLYQMGLEFPDHIVFIDDRRKHVEDVVIQCQNNGIGVTGLRYGACDQYYVT